MKPESSDLYLSAIYHLRERRQAVTTSGLAEELGVSMASVSEMLRKLGERGLVHYEPYQPVALTEQGRQRAAQLVRRHRLWEVFMVEKLGMGWETVYREACVLEHATSDAVAIASRSTNSTFGLRRIPSIACGGIVPAKPCSASS